MFGQVLEFQRRWAIGETGRKRVPSVTNIKPLYHWDVELQTLVPVPEGGERKRQPQITETTFNLIHALYKRYNGDVMAVYRATSWSDGLIYDVMKCDTFAEYREYRRRVNDERKVRLQQRTQQAGLASIETALETMPDAAELAEVVEEASPLQQDALERIINALEGIDVSLKGIREDTRQSLELTQKLYEIWKPTED